MYVRFSLIKLWWVFLLGFLVTLETNMGSVRCLEVERVALLRLKDAFNNPNGSALSSWQEQGGDDYCTWERIICNNSTKRVKYLLLNYTRPYKLSNLFWSLNASDFLPFEELQVLDLSGNYLSGLFGKIRLSNLQRFWLRNNQLTKVPSFDFSSSSKLEELNLDFNLLGGSIPESIMNLTSLQYLSFYVNNLNGSLPTTGGLCKLKNLRALDLSINHFEGHIPRCLANLSSLQLLDVSDNNFGGILRSSIIYSLKSLAYISLSDNHFKGSLSLSLLANHTNLQILDITSYNKQDVKVETENPPFFPHFQLKILNVVNCILNEPRYTIPTFLYHQHDLRMLHLAHTNMKGSFPNWLFTNNTKLGYFNLSHNSFSSPLAFNPTSKFLNMHTLDVSSNPIGGEIPPHVGSVFPSLISLNMSSSSLHGNFPGSFGYMRQLNYLDLSYNNLSGYLPQEFGKGGNDLQILKLSNNNFHGPFLPVGSNFTSLLSVHLANNNFTGKISNEIMKSKELRMLDLSNNQLHGQIPSWIGSFHNLAFLNLSQNSLLGPIPVEFCKLTELSYLDLSFNNLSGTLPNCLNMSSLRYLHLQSNQFNGPIPPTFANSKNLLILNLMKNKFSGPIPKWVDSFFSLKILILKGNKLEGSIPLEICHLRNINILDLSQNNLSGGIPYCFNDVAFGKLDVFNGMRIGKITIEWNTRATEYAYDPRTNEFVEGDQNILSFSWYEEIETDFMSKRRYESYMGNILDIMSGLDLSNNNFTGNIPPQMGYLSSLHTLNLSNNHLTGSIPDTFSNLNQIESLDLSNNMLTGRIPSQLTMLYSLSVFSVSHNNLSGRTPEMVNQFATFEASSYEDNPFLCGAPLEKFCSPNGKPIGMETLFHGHESDFWHTFVWSFVASFVVAFLGVIAYLYFNLYFFFKRSLRK